MAFILKSKPKVTLHATITRADGTVEDLGVIAEFKPDNIFTKFKSQISKLIYKIYFLINKIK